MLQQRRSSSITCQLERGADLAWSRHGSYVEQTRAREIVDAELVLRISSKDKKINKTPSITLVQDANNVL
jgi:hypothetical protein